MHKNVLSLGEQSELLHREETLACVHHLGFGVIHRFFFWAQRTQTGPKEADCRLITGREVYPLSMFMWTRQRQNIMPWFRAVGVVLHKILTAIWLWCTLLSLAETILCGVYWLLWISALSICLSPSYICKATGPNLGLECDQTAE